MGKGRFLNQRLGKRMSRQYALLRSHLAAQRISKPQGAVDLRLPKKGISRERKPLSSS